MNSSNTARPARSTKLWPLVHSADVMTIACCACAAGTRPRNTISRAQQSASRFNTAEMSPITLRRQIRPRQCNN